MNIFWLDSDYDTAATYMTDEHVGSKMIIEAAQIIGDALQQRGYDYDYLRGGYSNHPLTKWAAESSENAREVAKIANAMFAEKQYRYGGSHKSYVEGIRPIPWKEIDYGGEMSKPPLCVGRDSFGDRFVRDTIVDSYRSYYATMKVDDDSSWTNRDSPNWIEHYRTL